MFQEMLDVLRWSMLATNRFWRCIYGNSTWLSRDQATQLVKDGWAFTVPRLGVLTVHPRFDLLSRARAFVT